MIKPESISRLVVRGMKGSSKANVFRLIDEDAIHTSKITAFMAVFKFTFSIAP